MIRHQTEIMKLKLAKQSGWLTQEEYDEELKRSIQYWNSDFREAAYDLDAEDDYYDDEDDAHEAGDNDGNRVVIADNGDSTRQTRATEEESQLHLSVSETTKSQDPPNEKARGQVPPQPQMQDETELKCDTTEISQVPAEQDSSPAFSPACSPVGSLPHFTARIFGRGFGSYSGHSYATARASAIGGGANFASAPAFFGPEGQQRRMSDLLIDDESEEDFDHEEFHSRWRRDF
jgi:hypothetical protein